MTTRRETVGLLFRTVAHLTPNQVLHRLRLRAERPVIARFPAVAARLLARRSDGDVGWPQHFVPLDAQVSDAFPSAEANAAGEFRFLEETRSIGSQRDWAQPEAVQLWRYHLHYFEWAWAFADHADRTWARHAFAELWTSWRAASPLGRGDAWHPYTASLRAWVFCGVHRDLVAATGIAGDFADDLAVHAGYLRANVELDVGGNHLVKNLKALVGLGVFLDDERLRAYALRHLGRQFDVQVLSDGGHFERSPSYHCQVLGDLLDIGHLLDASGITPPDGLLDATKRMQEWLGHIVMPDGDVPLFNDCTLVGEDRIALLGPVRSSTSRSLTVLEPSGYVVVRPDERLHLVGDIGLPCPPELPAHAHADCLSFELAVDGLRVFVDTGTSTYQGERRAYERSTAAHNTVEVDGADQTEVWGTFRAARLARPRLEQASETGEGVVVSASHDGYQRLPGRPRHTRTWRCTPGAVEVVDELTGEGRHRASAFFHVAPDVEVVDDGHDCISLGPLTLRVSAEPTATISMAADAVSTGFGRLRQGTTVTVAVEGVLPMRVVSTIAAGDPAEGES